MRWGGRGRENIRNQCAVVLGRNNIPTESSKKKRILSIEEFSAAAEWDEREISERSAGQR